MLPRSSSGALYNKVQMSVELVTVLLMTFALPRSIILRLFLSSKAKFSGFRSRWAMDIECMYSRPRSMPWLQDFTEFFGMANTLLEFRLDERDVNKGVKVLYNKIVSGSLFRSVARSFLINFHLR